VYQTKYLFTIECVAKHFTSRGANDKVFMFTLEMHPSI